jgi:uroporphyrinogen decarboxylase
MDLPLKNPKPDIDRFCRMIRGEVIPKTPPLAELIVDYMLIQDISTRLLGRTWPEGNAPEAQREARRLWMEVWRRLGYDFVRWGGGLNFTGKTRVTEDTAVDFNRGQRHWTEEGTGPIASWEDFEKYPWPKLEEVDYSMVEYMAREVPEGMGLFLCPSSGFLEIPLDTVLGYENMALLLYDDPKLVKAVIDRCGELILGWYRHTVSLPNVRGFFQGDDMGFKTQPLVGPDTLRELILPWHKKAARMAHDHGHLYLFHSCGQIDSIMDDLIDDVKIDAKHSFEDAICPVADFKKKYGGRVAVLGGIDVHKLCTLSEAELRREVRRTLDACMPGGRFALGSGNSVANYVPLNNYLAMLHEGLNYGRV